MAKKIEPEYLELVKCSWSYGIDLSGILVISSSKMYLARYIWFLTQYDPSFTESEEKILSKNTSNPNHITYYSYFAKKDLKILIFIYRGTKFELLIISILTKKAV